MKLKYREKFLFSATWLVAITDTWHLANLVQRISIILTVIVLSLFTYSTIVDYTFILMTQMIFAMIASSLTGFHLVYTFFRKKFI